MADLFPTGPAPVLRPYQHRAIEMVHEAFRSGKRAPLLALATGSGKTVIAAEIVRQEAAAGTPVLVMAPRRELIHQTSATLARFGVRHGVLMAGEEARLSPCELVQVASIDTIVARALRRNDQRFLTPGLVIIDEAHLFATATRAKLLARWPDARRLGFTATPSRKDGAALGLLFDALLEPITIADLTAQGHLVPARYYSLSEPDLQGVGIVAGEYNQKQLAQAVDQPKLVADVVATWLARAATRRTVVFGVTIKHAIALADEFQRAGVAAEAVDAKTPEAERAAIFARFQSGATQVLTNCFLASYGFDCPPLDCVVLARPTRSLALYLQMLGRGLRPSEGKADCLVLDHAGAVHLHGFADEPRAWTLQGKGALATAPASASSGGDPDEPLRVDCPECQAVFANSNVCPACGHILRPRGKPVLVAEGELVEINARPQRADEAGRQQFHAELRAIADERGYKPGWAAMKFKERYGEWPAWPWNDLPTAEPTDATRRWVKSRAIAWAKAQQRQRA